MTDDQVASAVRAYWRAEANLERRRRVLFDAIGQAVLEDGKRQADIARLTGYTREHIRRICRDYADRKIGQQSSQF